MPLPIKLKKEGVFTVQDLLSRLEKEGFFCNRKSLWVYEKKGMLPVARRMKINKWEMRIYSQEEINEIVRVLKKLPIRKMIRHVE